MQAYQATTEDVEGVSHLFNAYRVFYGQPSDLESAKNFLQERLANEQSVLFVVKQAERYVGFTQLYPTYSSISMKKSWILNDMFVSADARKSGIGQVLLQKAADYALATGAKSIVLETAPDNYAAQKLYEKNGYVRDTEFLHYELQLDF